MSQSNIVWLNREVSDLKIKQVVFQMEADKALGPNRFPSSFFQKYWSDVGDSVVNFVRNALHTISVPKKANHTLICLVAKASKPETLSIMPYFPL